MNKVSVDIMRIGIWEDWKPDDSYEMKIMDPTYQIYHNGNYIGSITDDPLTGFYVHIPGKKYILPEKPILFSDAINMILEHAETKTNHEVNKSALCVLSCLQKYRDILDKNLMKDVDLVVSDLQTLVKNHG